MNLNLNFEDIRKRIEAEKDAYEGSWSKFIGVSSNVVSNIHGKMQQKPSFTYIISVAKATGKSVDYFLWGTESTEKGHKESTNNVTQVIIEHQDLIKRYKDPVLGKEINEQIIDIQNTDKNLFQSAVSSIRSLWDTAMAIRGAKGHQPPPIFDNLREKKEKEGNGLKNGTEDI